MSPIETSATDPIKSVVARTFDDAASSYDTIGPAYFSRFGARLVELAGVAPGMRVLDVGCGAGAALLAAAEAVGPAGDVVGIDISPAMVERSRSAAAARGFKHVEVRTGDAEIPGVPAADRDRVLAAQVLFFLPELARALRAYRHILKPDGLLALSSWGPDTKDWQAVQRSMFSFIPKDAVPRITPSGEVFQSDKTVAVALEDAGFVDVTSTTETYDVVFDSADQWLSWTRSHGARAYWDAIPVDRRADARAAGLAALGAVTDGNGRVTMPTTVRYTTAGRP